MADDRIEGGNQRLLAKAEQIIFDRESLTAIDISKLREEISKAGLLKDLVNEPIDEITALDPGTFRQTAGRPLCEIQKIRRHVDQRLALY